MSKKILLTGFKPFLSNSINPSEIVVQNLVQDTLDIEGLILPVSYEQSFAQLKEHWQRGNYKGLLMLGLAGGRNSICLERVALNWSETSAKDEDGIQLPPGPLITGAPESYINTFFPTSWKEELNKMGPASISFSAGTYVCNSLYFRALHELTGQRVPTLFVHVPYLPEQVKEPSEEPSMKLETQLATIKSLIRLLQGL